MKPTLEIAAFSLEAAIIAGLAGADRIELCLDYAQGGLTPPAEMIREATNRLNCPVFVMIRPRPGDFIYTEPELEQMKQALTAARQCGAQGFVFGILRENGEIDEGACRTLLALAHPLPCTFHRAFDRLSDQHAGLETLIRFGFRRVLTSGGPVNAAAHMKALKDLVYLAADRIIVMPGGGIRADNLGQLVTATGAKEYHTAAITDHSMLPDKQAIADMQQCLLRHT
jgi:copper homeostasis protein